MVVCFFFFFKQKTAYEIRPCDWSSDVCSSDLCHPPLPCRPAGSRSPRLPVPVPSRRAEPSRRSEERRVGKECTGLCRSLWWPGQLRKKETEWGWRRCTRQSGRRGVAVVVG